MEQLLKLLNGIFPLSQPLRAHLKRKIRMRKFKKGTTILALGDICDSILFIEKGLVRSYYLLDGEEVSNWFMKEGDIFVSVLSFFRRQPTVDALVAVEDCVCWGITFDELEEMRGKYVESFIHSYYLSTEYYCRSEERHQDRRQQTPERKYELFLKREGDLLARLRNKDVASYLDIGLRTYIKTRSEYAKKKKDK